MSQHFGNVKYTFILYSDYVFESIDGNKYLNI